MANPDVGWSQSTRKYNDDTVMMITNLDILWLTRYPVWQEMHKTSCLYFLFLSFKILNNIE